ncbi:uncharacterized protein C8R40DRAFT_1173588 [Lentinula edodes]|uniref:uncharacterized protein n=1 Tax=Lentinula edodes TaxID=5353 RepID=UPI001E8DC95E|nr:uncharacterized protein C8R40DRAFT_1173588 [Lentinula edodes]KAH7872500.1 hypothetical protein C8R40DRAFT_1173588 [Lentinula edodes]
MSQFNYLPNSLPSATFKMRANPGGIYDRLAKSFTEMGPIALANAEINQDFFPHNFGESWSMNYSYRDCDSALFSANVFGEIVGQAHGTFVGAQGNHYAGKDPSNPTVLDDYTKTKCTIVLACPSFATPPITNLFYNQLCTLDSVRDEDKKGEIRSGLSVDAKEIAKSIRTGGDLDAIILTGPALYTVLKKGKSSGKDNNISATSPPRRALKKRSLAAASNDDMPLLQDTSETPLPTAEKHIVWPTAEEIFVGAEYDHRLMPDFGGPVFAFEKARLIQPDWRDVNGDLIPPWLNHKLLRPGTLVVANMSIQVYVMISKSGDGMVRKIYHAILNSLRVVAVSDVLITPPVPLLHRTSLPRQNTSQTAAALALAALNFNVEQSMGASSSLASSNTPGSDSTVDSDNLDTACDREVLSILASSTWIGENFGLKHPASCVDRLSLTYRKIVLPNHLLTLKRSLHNISVFHAQWNLSALRFASVNLTLADLFPGEIPASFQKLTKLYLTCQANPTCQRLCTRLTCQLFSSALKSVTFDLQVPVNPVDFSTLAKFMINIHSTATNLHTLNLTLDNRRSRRSYQILQDLLNCPTFIFLQLQRFSFHDTRSVFDVRDFVNRHHTLLWLSFVATVYHFENLVMGATVPDLVGFEGGVVHATQLLQHPGCRIKSLHIVGPSPTAITWYDFTSRLHLSEIRSVTDIHLRGQGGYLFRHINDLTAASPDIEVLSFALSDLWSVWRVDRFENIFKIILSRLQKLRSLVVMVRHGLGDVGLSLTKAVAELPQCTQLNSIRLYVLSRDHRSFGPLFNWGGTCLGFKEVDYEKEYRSLADSFEF